MCFYSRVRRYAAEARGQGAPLGEIPGARRERRMLQQTLHKRCRFASFACARKQAVQKAAEHEDKDSEDNDNENFRTNTIAAAHDLLVPAKREKGEE